MIRDRDWGTFATTRADAHAEGAALVVEGTSEADGARVDWTLRATFDDASLALALEARAATAFLRNRLGLIVLHGVQSFGAPLEVRHTDGAIERIRFPDRISPHQPARDVAGLAWTADGVAVTAAFEGDVFEMEDQRNWTDASYKTYSTPLDRPFPVSVAKGEVVRQSLALTCSGTARLRDEAASPPRIEAVDGRFPEIQTVASSAPTTRRPAEHRLRGVGLLAEIDPHWAGWRRSLARVLEEADGRPVDLRIVATTPADVDTVLEAAGAAPLARLGVFDAQRHSSTPELSAAIRRAGGERGIEVVGGVRSHFTELNRGSRELADADAALAFSLTPFMHDTSGHQLVESLAVQRTVLRDALAIARGRRLHVGPVTLGARMNAVATTPLAPGGPDVDASGYGPEHVPGATDARQASPSLAAWVVGSLAALARPGVDSVTYFEEWGPRGAVGTPAGRVLEWAAELSGDTLLAVHSDALVGVGVVRREQQVLLLGNAGGAVIEPSVDGVRDWLRSGDGSRGEGPLRLGPGEAARVVRDTRPE